MGKSKKRNEKQHSRKHKGALIDMKKIICTFLSFILILSLCFSAFANEDENSDASSSADSSIETTQNTSQPKLLVESYTLSKSQFLPNESATLEIKLKNYSSKKSVNNITVSISDETGEVSTQELNSNYISKITPNGEYVLTKTLKVSKSAVEGTHKLGISCEYEDDDFVSYTTSSQIPITVLKVKETTTKPSTTKETTQNASHPQLIVASYSLESGFISPSKSSTLHITLKNESKSKTIKNLKITLGEEKGNIKFKKESVYIGDIKPKATHTLSLEISASKTAEIGEHKIVVSGEYEDKYFTQFTSTDNITVNVKQKTGLDYDGIILPKRIVQDDTVTMEINLMNTGKSQIRNAKISFDIDSLQTGGVLFFGEIKAGENKNESVNFQASSTKLGKINGTATLSYEDEFGKTYNEKINLSSEIIKKKITKETDEEKKTAKYPLWWLFSIVGLVLGSIITAGIILTINSNKKRKEDEKRL